MRPSLNVALAFALLVAQDFAAGRYGLFSLAGAVVVSLPLVVALAASAVAAGFARALSPRDAKERRRVAASLLDGSAALVALVYFFAPVRALPSLVGLVSGSAALAWLTGIAGAAVVFGVVAWLPRRFVTLLLTVTLGAALAVAIGEGAWNRATAPAGPSTPARDDLANVYVVVLDGQSSPAAFPGFAPGAAALRERMRRDYRAAGFELFERVHANHIWTDRSLQSILDGRVVDEAPPARGGAIRMPPNALFDAFGARGYQLRIHDSSYLDLCGAAAAWTPTCLTYPAHNLGPGPVGAREIGLLLSGLVSRLSNDAGLEARRRAFSAINSVHALDAVIDDVTRHPRGQLVVAHVLLPHEPFVLGPDCRLRDGALRDFDPIDRHARLPLPAARRAWQRYLQQVECAHGRVMALVGALREAGTLDANTLLVFGDHGARLSVDGWRPRSRVVPGRLFLDFYAPLFALSRGAAPLAPSTAAGRDAWASASTVIAGLMGWSPPADAETLRRNRPDQRYLPDLEAAEALLAP